VDFSLRQWLTILGAVVVFLLAALAVRGDQTGSAVATPPFDGVAWCQSANAISTWRSVLDGSAEGDSIDDVANLRTELDRARSTAPSELRTEVARLYDLILLTMQASQRLDGDLEAAIVDAAGNTDQPRVQTALRLVDEAVVACGHRSLVG